MNFPHHRPRRMRGSDALRRLIRETHLTPDDLILPLFAVDGKNIKDPIVSLPGQFRLSCDNIVKIASQAVKIGIPGIILFGVSEKKDALGSGAYAKDGIVPNAIRQIKEKVPDIAVISDVCLCQYTDHGHCGVVNDGIIDNDASLERVAQTALAHASAGADMVAPSGMLDGRIGIMRALLDENGFSRVPIMSYAVKYCSAFYGPFREAADSAPKFGDRRTYQMDPANALEAYREVWLDVEESADIIMIKPALAYLDIIRRIKDAIDLPVAAYNVSGEYAMIKAAGNMGWIDEGAVVAEVLTSIKRAGADMILTYFALEVAELL